MSSIYVNGIEILPPTTKREAGDELARRAIDRVKADPRTSVRDAVRTELQRDTYLAGRYAGVEGNR